MTVKNDGLARFLSQLRYTTTPYAGTEYAPDEAAIAVAVAIEHGFLAKDEITLTRKGIEWLDGYSTVFEARWQEVDAVRPVLPASKDPKYLFKSLYQARGDVHTSVFYHRLTKRLGERNVEILELVVGEGMGYEATERKLGLPSRSAKAVVSYAIETFDLTAREMCQCF